MRIMITGSQKTKIEIELKRQKIFCLANLL